MSDEWKGGYKHFSEKEMRCKGLNCDCGGKGLPKHSLMIHLEAIREDVDFPIVINSAYRCPSHNAEESDTGQDGPHTTGLSVDVKAFGEQAMKILASAIRNGVTGIGISQKGKVSKRFLHLDWIKPGGRIPRPFLWSY